MDLYRRGWLSILLLFLLPIVLIVGMVFGFRLRDSLLKRNEALERIVDLVNAKYVDTVSSSKLYNDAAEGLLKSLDPHTVYIPPDDLQGINDDLDGGFSGIGVEFSILRDTIEVTSVVENGPAGKAGIGVGDQFIKVDDSIVAGTHTGSDRIVRLLKGRQNSSVYLTVRRPAGDVKQVTLTRDIIPIHSVEASLMLDEMTGYIKITRFSATTYSEFSTALKKLKDAGATQLIIDLRDNPGGYIDAATSIADDLLDSNKLIVYTKGIRSPKTEYRAGEKGLFETGKLAILVDEGAASASEILAGAIQDWDRGLIIGRRTFGKGLVQEQYDLPNGGALRLTVAKYYTPSGRCIQRSFANGRDAYEEDYEKRFETGALTTEDTTDPGDAKVYYTHKKRVVYGGGGIKPDIYVPYDTSLLSGSLLDMIYSDELKTAILDYFIRNKEHLKYKSISDFNHSFNEQEKVAGNYLAMYSPDLRGDVQKELSKPFSNDYFRTQIKAQLARFLFHDNGYYSISLKKDDAVNKALASFNTPRYSAIVGGHR